MSLHFVANTIDELLFSDTPPDHLKPLIVNGATCQAASGSFGYILSQQISTSRFIIRQLHLQFRYPTKLKVTHESPLVEIHLNLGPLLHLHLNGLGNLSFKKGTYNIIYSPALKNELFLQIEQAYQILSISCPVELLASLSQAFPVMKKLVEQTQQQQPAILFACNASVSRELMQIIQNIINCEYTGELLQAYREARITDLLLLCLTSEPPNPHRPGVRLLAKDIDIIEAIKAELLNNLDKTYTLDELAHKAGMNKTKLTKGFKQVTGAPLYNFQLHARLEKANRLLLTTQLPISAIGTEIGYFGVDGFSKAFKKQYGLSPSDFRKKHGIDLDE